MGRCLIFIFLFFVSPCYAWKPVVPGGVSSVTGSAPIVSSGGSNPSISIPAATDSVNGYMSSSFVSKLNGIQAGANVNVNPDWNATDGDALILNKPDLSSKADLVGGIVPSAQLPSYLDTIIEAANYAALPGTGVLGKIYVTVDDNKTYRWSGTIYVEISASLVLGETSATAYRGDRGKVAYDISIGLGSASSKVAPSTGVNATTSQVVMGDDTRLSDNRTASGIKTATTTVNTSSAAAPSTGQVLIATSSTAASWQNAGAGTVASVSGTSPILSSGGATPTISLPAATAGINGYMTSVFASKLDGIQSGANVNVNADWNAVSGDAFILNKPDMTNKADLVGGIVPSSQLPSYLDTMVEVANFSSLPSPGVSGRVYVTIDNNKTYRWSGSVYSELSVSLVLGETSSTAYRGDRGKIAYDAAIGLGSASTKVAPSTGINATSSQVVIGDDTRLTDTRTASGIKTATTTVSVSSSPAPSIGQVLVATSPSAATWQTAGAGTITAVTGTSPVVSSGGLTPAISMPAATALGNGFMSSTYASKLDGIATNANNYVHPATDGSHHVPATSTTHNGQVLVSGATAGSESWGTIPAHTQSWSTITGTPTTLSGYGITDSFNPAAPGPIGLTPSTGNFTGLTVGASGISVQGNVASDGVWGQWIYQNDAKDHWMKLHPKNATAVSANYTVDIINSSGEVHIFVSVPSSASTSCIVGMYSWDSNYDYRCVSANSWQRSSRTWSTW